MRNTIFYRGLITGILLLVDIILSLIRSQINLYFGIACIIVGGLQTLSSFGCKYKTVWQIHISCFFLEILYYIVGFLYLTFMLAGGRLPVVEYAVWMISMAITSTWLLFAVKALLKIQE